jgi:hypothetical protein
VGTSRPAFKAKVATAAIRVEMTLSNWHSFFDVQPIRSRRAKRSFKEGAAERLKLPAGRRWWRTKQNVCSPRTRRIIITGASVIGTVDGDMEVFAHPILCVSPLKRKID